jgi:hypothetical protein
LDLTIGEESEFAASPLPSSAGFSSSGTSNHCTNIFSHQAGLTLLSLWICQHLQNAFREVFVDFGVSRTGWKIFVTGL